MMLQAAQSFYGFGRRFLISRLQRFQNSGNRHLGRCPRLLHFAPLALEPGVIPALKHRAKLTGH